ncbi:MAG: hypothetical protein U0L10_02560 [Lachnospiraceae bacterium]|jgi:hypothetical protein|nr:hypothetical protein [Lachnospiraceae bacterium]
MKLYSPTIEELYEVYIDANDSFDGALRSMDEIQTELEEGISCLSAALDEIRDEIESCRKAFQQLTRRMPSEFLAYQNAQEKFWDQPDEGLPFETTTGIT